jgi:predicted short-subunit dehydrogenase-like oxidoreductase (DUF2520 family)
MEMSISPTGNRDHDMLTLRMSRSVSIVGAGRLGRTLGRRLHRLGWRIGAVVTRSEFTSRRAQRFIGGGKPCASLTREILHADVILLAVPDGALEGLARSLARVEPKKWEGKVVLHTSGALDRSVLQSLAKCGAATGSLHPMQTFSGHRDPNLAGVVFGVEGAPRAIRAATSIARALGGVPVTVEGKKKISYHAAAVLVAGLGLALAEGATQVLLSLGFTRRRALQALLPLMREMLHSFEQQGPHTAWTGPISRADYGTVALHANALRRQSPELQETYQALARLSARVLSKKYATTLKDVNRALGKSRRSTN